MDPILRTGRNRSDPSARDFGANLNFLYERFTKSSCLTQKKLATVFHIVDSEGVCGRVHVRVHARNLLVGSRRRSAWWAISLIVLGVLLASLVRAAVAFTLVIAWLIALAGLAHLIIAHHAHRRYILIWRLIVGFAYVLFGVYVIAHPGMGLVSLTLGWALLLLFEGVFDILVFFRLRSIERLIWVLVKGIVTLMLGLMFYLEWPSIPRWAIGVLVGAAVVTNGVTLVILWLASHDAMTRRNQDDLSAKDYWKIHG